MLFIFMFSFSGLYSGSHNYNPVARGQPEVRSPTELSPGTGGGGEDSICVSVGEIPEHL